MKQSWQQRMRTENVLLAAENRKLAREVADLKDKVATLTRVNNQYNSTVEVCGKIAESAVQLTCSANTLLDRAIKRW